MKNFVIVMCITVITVGIAHAYNGRTTIIMQSENKYGVQFDVSFQKHDDMLLVTVVAPQKVETIPLAEFTVIQIENEKVLLRVPISAAEIKVLPVPNKDGKFMLTTRKLNPRVHFAVSQTRLPETKLEVKYSNGESGWTYVVDIASYQPKEIE